MLTENDVVDAVAAYLPKLGYRVESKCTTVQTGVDIVAKKKATGHRLRVEAKGGTSSKEHTARYSLGFNPGQVKSHVSRALYEAVAMQCEHKGDQVALAFPDDKHHRTRVDCIAGALKKLGIEVFFVAADKSVQRFDCT